MFGPQPSIARPAERTYGNEIGSRPCGRRGVSLPKLAHPPIRLALKRPYGPNRSFNPENAASPVTSTGQWRPFDEELIGNALAALACRFQAGLRPARQP